eukprot:TRINITY_DN5719_c0_g1_i1.p1 TRINITY_DN5719_c0_g1~~TRINITY_DN5719_c0_g1_i1.p1  ORF type:complete len:998 (+),score=253.45 TRINITY_DN5719_c0_g1_i1:161-3154(+)
MEAVHSLEDDYNEEEAVRALHSVALKYSLRLRDNWSRSVVHDVARAADVARRTLLALSKGVANTRRLMQCFRRRVVLVQAGIRGHLARREAGVRRLIKYWEGEESQSVLPEMPAKEEERDTDSPPPPPGRRRSRSESVFSGDSERSGPQEGRRVSFAKLVRRNSSSLGSFCSAAVKRQAVLQIYRARLADDYQKGVFVGAGAIMRRIQYEELVCTAAMVKQENTRRAAQNSLRASITSAVATAKLQNLAKGAGKKATVSISSPRPADEHGAAPAAPDPFGVCLGKTPPSSHASSPQACPGSPKTALGSRGILAAAAEATEDQDPFGDGQIIPFMTQRRASHMGCGHTWQVLPKVATRRATVHEHELKSLERRINWIQGGTTQILAMSGSERGQIVSVVNALRRGSSAPSRKSSGAAASPRAAAAWVRQEAPPRVAALIGLATAAYYAGFKVKVRLALVATETRRAGLRLRKRLSRAVQKKISTSPTDYGLEEYNVHGSLLGGSPTGSPLAGSPRTPRTLTLDPSGPTPWNRASPENSPCKSLSGSDSVAALVHAAKAAPEEAPHAATTPVLSIEVGRRDEPPTPKEGHAPEHQAAAAAAAAPMGGRDAFPGWVGERRPLAQRPASAMSVRSHRKWKSWQDKDAMMYGANGLLGALPRGDGDGGQGADAGALPTQDTPQVGATSGEESGGGASGDDPVAAGGGEGAARTTPLRRRRKRRRRPRGGSKDRPPHPTHGEDVKWMCGQAYPPHDARSFVNGKKRIHESAQHAAVRAWRPGARAGAPASKPWAVMENHGFWGRPHDGSDGERGTLSPLAGASTPAMSEGRQPGSVFWPEARPASAASSRTTQLRSRAALQREPTLSNTCVEVTLQASPRVREIGRVKARPKTPVLQPYAGVKAHARKGSVGAAGSVSCPATPAGLAPAKGPPRPVTAKEARRQQDLSKACSFLKSKQAASTHGKVPRTRLGGFPASGLVGAAPGSMFLQHSVRQVQEPFGEA